MTSGRCAGSTAPTRAARSGGTPALGIDPKLRPLDALKAWMGKRKDLRLIAPVKVKRAAFLENSAQREKVDLAKFPAPFWHKQGGVPYFGSGSLVIRRDPDTGWINASI